MTELSTGFIDYSRHLSEPKFGEIYTADLHYQDHRGRPRPGKENHKRRPVLFHSFKIDNNGRRMASVIMISSQSKNKWNHDHGYELKDWPAEGLKKKSYVTPTVDRIYHIPEKGLFRKNGRPVGRLTKRDQLGVANIISRELTPDQTKQNVFHQKNRKSKYISPQKDERDEDGPEL